MGIIYKIKIDKSYKSVHIAFSRENVFIYLIFTYVGRLFINGKKIKINIALVCYLFRFCGITRNNIFILFYIYYYDYYYFVVYTHVHYMDI